MLYIYIFALIISTLVILTFINGEKSIISDRTRSNAPGKFIRLSKGYTHYETAGDENKPVVLFIHGFSVPYYMWDKTFHPVAEAGYRVIRYDIFGRGLSDRPKTVYDVKLFTEQITGLLDSLQITEKINIAGTSMGGAVAAAFASAYPDKINKIILIDPVYSSQKITFLRFPVVGDFIAYVFKIPRFPEKQMTDFFRPEKFMEWPELYREQMKYKGFKRAILSTFRNFLSHDPLEYYESLKNINKEILLIWGMEDKVTPIHGAAKLYGIFFPDLLLLEEAGHLPHYEIPEKVNPAIIEFLYTL